MTSAIPVQRSYQLSYQAYAFIRGQCLYEGGVYLKSNLFLANETVHCENSGEGA